LSAYAACKSLITILMMMTVISLSLPRMARAGSGKIFLETIGISTAVGTVLGASTLPFYDQPGTHLINLVYGASMGAVAGVGLGLYQWLSGRSERNHEIFGDFRPGYRTAGRASLARRMKNDPAPVSVYASSSLFSSTGRMARDQRAAVENRSPVLIWAPLVSLTW